MQQYVQHLLQKLPWLPKNILKAKSDDIFGSFKGKELIRTHKVQGKHKVENFRNMDLPMTDCKCCATKSRSSMRYIG